MKASAALTNPFAVLDVESFNRGTGWDEFRLARFVTSDGDVECFETLDGMQKFVADYPGTVWAHAGGLYDFAFLGGKDQVCLTGSRVLSATFGKAKLKDSYPLFLMALAKIGKAVGLPKLDVDRGNLDALTDSEVGRYCERDCEVLIRGLLAHREFCASIPLPEGARARWPSTAGSTAVYLAESTERDTVARLAAFSLDLEAWDRQCQTVVGGRTELWQLGEVPGPVYVYDIKSSYPSRYFEGPMPVGPWRWVPTRQPGLPEHLDAAAHWHVAFEQPKERLPLLTSNGVHVHKGEGWCTGEELRVARDELGARVKVLGGWVSAGVSTFGRAFATELYRRKEAGEPFAKVSINSLHGKLGERLQTEIRHRRADGTYAIERQLSLPRWFQRPLLEACVYARARLALWRVLDGLRRAGFNVFYTDTDCAHTDAPPDHFQRVAEAVGQRVGGELGQWELKCTAERALYLAPKTYGLDLGAEGIAIASKGFPSSLMTWALLERAWERPEEVKAYHGLKGFRSGGADGAHVRLLQRTLRAHPGTGKVRQSGDAVWYQH